MPKRISAKTLRTVDYSPTGPGKEVREQRGRRRNDVLELPGARSRKKVTASLASEEGRTMVEKVARHYAGAADIAKLVAESLRKAGKDIDKLATEDLAAVDEFHIR